MGFHSGKIGIESAFDTDYDSKQEKGEGCTVCLSQYDNLIQ